jgi:hypothetical protein
MNETNNARERTDARESLNVSVVVNANNANGSRGLNGLKRIGLTFPDITLKFLLKARESHTITTTSSMHTVHLITITTLLARLQVLRPRECLTIILMYTATNTNSDRRVDTN